MAWIFQQCPDEYGLCIRQYVVIVLSLGMSILGIYTCVKVYLAYRKIVFDLLPLVINSLASLMIFALEVQIELYGTHLLLFVIEIYSYFIMAFAFMSLHMGTNQPRRLKLLNIVFILVTTVSVAALIIILVLTQTKTIQCSDEHGVGSVAMVILEIPLYITTFVFIFRIKGDISRTLAHHAETDKLSTETHLIQRDQQLYFKQKQTHWVMVSFTCTVLLHLISLCLYYFPEEEISCNQGEGMRTRNLIELLLMLIDNCSQLLPHFTIPLIFWLFSGKFRDSRTLYITSPEQKQSSSNFKEDLQNDLLFKQVQQERLTNSPSSPVRKL